MRDNATSESVVAALAETGRPLDTKERVMSREIKVSGEDIDRWLAILSTVHMALSDMDHYSLASVLRETHKEMFWASAGEDPKRARFGDPSDLEQIYHR